MVVIHWKKLESGVGGDLDGTDINLRVARGCRAIGGVENISVRNLGGDGHGEGYVVDYSFNTKDESDL